MDARDPGRLLSPLVVWPVVAILAIAAVTLVWPDVLIEGSIGDFIIVTLFLGCGAAWLTGRSVARSWAPYVQLLVYCALLTAAVRFGHFALFERPLFAWRYYAIEFVLLSAVATLGFRALRQQQMTKHYDWLYAPAGTFSWRAEARPTQGGDIEAEGAPPA